MLNRTRATGTLLTAISALGFSTLPLFGVAAYGAGANVTTFLGIRFLVASALLWGYLLIRRAPLPDLRTSIQLLLMGAVGYTTMSALYLSSVAEDRLSPSLAALLLYTYPAIVCLLTWWLDKQRLTWRQWFALIAATFGVIMVLVAPGAKSVFTLLGAGMALGAALVYATYIFLASRVARRVAPVVTTTYVSTAAALAFLGYGIISGGLVPVAISGWAAMAGAGLFATVIAVLTFFAGMERLGPAQASMISTLEPVGTALLSTFLLHEQLGSWQVGGGALVLASVIWLQLGKNS